MLIPRDNMPKIRQKRRDASYFLLKFQRWELLHHRKSNGAPLRDVPP
jgi:hypothetical protein